MPSSAPSRFGSLRPGALNGPIFVSGAHDWALVERVAAPALEGRATGAALPALAPMWRGPYDSAKRMWTGRRRREPLTRKETAVMLGATGRDAVASRRIGDAVVTIISEGRMLWAPQLLAPEAEWRRAMPEALPGGELPLGLNVAHIRVGTASLLIDPGFPDPHDPAGRRDPAVTRSAGLLAGLAAIGVQPDEITHVLITHAHGDHVGGLTVERGGGPAPRFPNAPVFLGRAEWERPAVPSPAPLVALERLGLLELIDAEREAAPAVAMLPAPGESAGHCIVRLRSGADTFYYLGDLFHHACEVEHPEWVSPGRDPVATLASRRRLLREAAASRATLVFTHEPFPPWGRVAADGDGFRWERGAP